MRGMYCNSKFPFSVDALVAMERAMKRDKIEVNDRQVRMIYINVIIIN